MKRPLALLAAALFPHLVVAQTTAPNSPPLTEPERAMVAYIDANEQAANDLLAKLVSINSGTHNLEGVREVGRILSAQLTDLGFQVRWVDMSQVGRAGVLVAEHPCPQPGHCGKRMLLIGHMDTVFEKNSPFQAYTPPAAGSTIATGPGTNDMKGGLVDMVYALKAMQTADVLKQAEITVVLSGDEEAHGEPVSISRRDMVEAARHSDVALEFEGTPRLHGIYYGSVSRRSSISWTIKASGETGHSSAIFSEEKGYGAIYEVARILDAFRTQLPEAGLTYNVGMILGGATVTVDKAGDNATVAAKGNIIPPTAYASGDIRTLSNEQTERVEQKMQAIVAQHLPKTGATISFGEGYPAMAATSESRAVLAILNQANASLGFTAMPELDPMKRGAGDIAFVADMVPGLAGVGATGDGAHAPGETIDLAAQPINTKRDAILMYRLSRIAQNADLVEAAKSAHGH
ncbi:M20/M25/M40 family metallo-hydrolase [Silvibacterium dinghuense]|uniref:M20/M25/M40 family metallo-hydrolase n=1 Tax=Silvibacterium dinghuense TaxID=1560006 RepID=A0A4Q1SEE4_9BACT|nr:M20/M25/M40 family metallo-hydrolase [Silvibacterium dinghuense]RXS95632.1 M20/M25/M40 family metallo-hydrolase [Silvibacterium dinghuense]GGH14550.1 peptidase M20 [Silvibacterium dinghuense]